MARDRRCSHRHRRPTAPRNAGLQTGIARAAGETPSATHPHGTQAPERRPPVGTASRRLAERISLFIRRMLRRPIPGIDACFGRLRNRQSTPARAWSPHPPTPPQRGAARPQRGVPASRPRFSVELTGLSVELAPADPASAWSWAPSAWSCGRQIPLQRGADRLQRRVPANRSRYSVGLDGSSVELTPADPASAWSSAASAWSCPRQIPLQRGARRPQRGARPGRSRFSVELTGSSVELAPADPATRVELGGFSVEFPRQIPLQRGARRLQRGAAPSRSRYSVELGGLSVELAPAVPATAWS